MIFRDSKELRKIIEKHDWTLYFFPIDSAPPWDAIEKLGPAEQFEVGYNYVFTPITKKGQTLREAYMITKGLGPCLTIDPAWEGITEVYKGKSSVERDNEILFTRLWFANEKSTVAISPKTRDNWDPIAADIRNSHLIETFEKYFRIARPEEYGLSVPVPAPLHAEDN